MIHMVTHGATHIIAQAGQVRTVFIWVTPRIMGGVDSGMGMGLSYGYPILTPGHPGDLMVMGMVAIRGLGCIR